MKKKLKLKEIKIKTTVNPKKVKGGKKKKGYTWVG